MDFVVVFAWSHSFFFISAAPPIPGVKIFTTITHFGAHAHSKHINGTKSEKILKNFKRFAEITVEINLSVNWTLSILSFCFLIVVAAIKYLRPLIRTDSEKGVSQFHSFYGVFSLSIFLSLSPSLFLPFVMLCLAAMHKHI